MANYNRSVFTTTTAEQGVVYDYMQDEKAFIAAEVFSPKPVDRANKKITQMDTSKLKVYDTQRATNSEAEIINEGSFTRDISLKEHKLEFEINPQLVRDSDLQILDGVRPIQMATHGLLMKREAIAASLATTSGNYPSALTSAIASGSRWNEANGDPEADMATARIAVRNQSGITVNALAIDITTVEKLKLSPSFRDRVKFTKGTPVSEDDLKAFFGVDHLFIGKARQNTANEGATASLSGFWGDNAVAFYYNPGVSMFDVSFGQLAMYGQGGVKTYLRVDEKKQGASGPMRYQGVVMEYVCTYGYVESAESTKFAAGYLLRTVVA